MIYVDIDIAKLNPFASSISSDGIELMKPFKFSDDFQTLLYDLDLMDLKTLGRFRQKTIKQRTRLKIQLPSYMNQVCIRMLSMLS